MPERRKPFPILRHVVLAAGLSLAGAVLFTPDIALAGPVDEKKAASSSGSVQITTVATDIEVLGTKKKEVSVSGDIVKGATLEFESRKSSTVIEVKPPKGHSEGKGALVVRVPEGSEVHVKTVAGHLRMSAIDGSAELESVSGNVTVDGSPRELSAVSVSGNLFVVAASKRTFAKSVSGKVHVSGSRGKLEASSVSGRLEIDNAKVSKAQLATVSGSITFAGALLEDGPHEIKSHAGKITLKLPPKQPVIIDASSFSGTIRDKIGDERARGKARISIGKGGPRVKVRSFSGGIVIEPQ